MRGDPQALVARLPRVAHSRRLRARIAEAVERRRELRLERLRVTQRLEHETRHARERGQYVPEFAHRVRPW